MTDYPDFEGAKSKLFTVADWAAVEATDKNFLNVATAVPFGSGAVVIYTVPTGKTLYITGLSFAIYANDATDGDSNQMGIAYISNITDSITNPRIGGNGGGVANFTKPLTFAAGKQVRFYVTNKANHDCDVGISAWGYEI